MASKSFCVVIAGHWAACATLAIDRRATISWRSMMKIELVFAMNDSVSNDSVLLYFCSKPWLCNRTMARRCFGSIFDGDRVNISWDMWDPFNMGRVISRGRKQILFVNEDKVQFVFVRSVVSWWYNHRSLYTPCVIQGAQSLSIANWTSSSSPLWRPGRSFSYMNTRPIRSHMSNCLCRFQYSSCMTIYEIQAIVIFFEKPI